MLLKLLEDDERVGQRETAGQPGRLPLVDLAGKPATPLHSKWHVGGGFIVCLPLSGPRFTDKIVVVKRKPIKDTTPDEQPETLQPPD